MRGTKNQDIFLSVRVFPMIPAPRFLTPASAQKRLSARLPVCRAGGTGRQLLRIKALNGFYAFEPE